jgi:hypothetical protein
MRVARVGVRARALLLVVLLAPAADMLRRVSRPGASLVCVTLIPQPSSEPRGRPARAAGRSYGSHLRNDREATSVVLRSRRRRTPVRRPR